MFGLGVNRLGIVSALRDIYGVIGTSPEFVADFTREYFRTDSAACDFDTAFDFTRSGLATMVDSDGVLKWAPHNLVLNSENYSAWTKISVGGGTNPTIDATGIEDPDGTLKASKITFSAISATDDASLLRSQPFSSEPKWTFKIFVKASGSGDVGKKIHLYDDVLSSPVEITLTDSYQLTSYTNTNARDRATIGVIGSFYSGSTVASQSAVTVDIAFSRVYRSDLGGMVNNPFRGDSYVPTTSSAVYLPRLGHHVWDGSQWVNEGLLIESEARTNLLTSSNDLTGGGWVETGCVLSANKVECDSSTAGHIVYEEVSVTSGEAYCYSFIAKAAEQTSVQIFTSSQFAPDYINFDLSSGLVVGSGGLAGDIVDMGGGEYLVYATASATATGTGRIGICLNNGADSRIPSVSGENGNGIEVYHTQWEAGSTPSSRIPTSGSTATRAAETKDSDSLSHDSSAMWFALEGIETYADEGTAGQVTLFDWRADANNRITVTLDTDSTETGEITLTVVSGGTSWSVAADYLSPGINQPFSIAWRVTSSEINLAVGGTAQTAVSTTSIPDLSAATASWEGMGARALFRQGTGDVGDSGIAEASS